ncbi:MAG TPA: ThiF family adenylyltransferase [Smithellaceae bacterium]|nr:ThiF family adenylyltransferase [Smithellaceae bacterium]
METDLFIPDGEIVRLGQLEIEKVRDLVLMLDAGKIPFASLVECRKMGLVETVVFEVEVEVPQLCRYQVRPSEPIAATFHKDDSTFPIVHALRKDFPQVPHLNLHIQEFPRNLCIYAERYEEIKRRWTSPRFVHRIRDWLALTARGELHQEDQPLEQILIDHVGHLVLPARLLEEADDAQPIFIDSVRPVEKEKLFLIAQQQQPQDGALSIVASVHRCSPQTHGVIYKRPITLADLSALVDRAGLDILAELRSRLKNWLNNKKSILDSHILLVIQFPKRRSDDEEVEAVDTWAFLLGDAARTAENAGDLRIRDLGTRIGLWDIQDKQVGLLLSPDTSKRGENVGLDVLNVSFQLTRLTTASLNGFSTIDDIRIVAIGAGALGSQTLMNLARGGFGTWTIVDHDRLMPHNIARHMLTGHFVGWKKAEAVALLANSIAGDTDLFTALSVDVLAPGERNADIVKAFHNAEAILDMSTSIAVARKIVRDVESDARRISLFLTPSGRSLVLLAEDKGRTMPLDALEMQYYRAVANNDRLEKHFQTTGNRTRYGQSCRDITSTLPQNLVALHAAIGAQAIRNTINDHSATAVIWQEEGCGKVERTDIELTPVIHHRIESWTVITDEGLLQKLGMFRQARLPNETGGVLLGSFDLDRKILYIVDALPSPPDSEEWPTLYIRGRKGLRQAVDALEEKTHGMLEYIGEWHSHPPGARLAASCDDLKVFAWLTELMQADGLPGLMMIVGDPGRTSCYVGEIMKEENLLPEASSHE